MRGDTGLSQVNQMRSIALLDVSGVARRSIAEVARQCGLSRGHFVTAFKVSTGCTPSQWLLVRKIDKAKLLLKGPLPIAAISAECGFADQAHLTRVFNMAVGTTPGRWRAEHRQRP